MAAEAPALAPEKPKGQMGFIADILLLAVAIVWGATFVVVKNALDDIGPHWFIGIRFWIAFIVLAGIYRQRLWQYWRRQAREATLIGLFLFAGYALQTIGLQYTTASNSGFITGLSVVLVPIVGRWWGQASPGRATWLGISCAVVGLGLLTFNGALQFNSGDAFTLLATLAFACQIAMVGYHARRGDAIVLAILQIGVVAVGGTVGGVLLEPVPTHFTHEVWIALAATAIPATALAFLIQNTMQRYTTPTRTAIIFALEPVFAGITAYLLLGEVLTAQQIGGCCLIVAGMLITELGGSPQPE